MGPEAEEAGAVDLSGTSSSSSSGSSSSSSSKSSSGTKDCPIAYYENLGLRSNLGWPLNTLKTIYI